MESVIDLAPKSALHDPSFRNAKHRRGLVRPDPCRNFKEVGAAFFDGEFQGGDYVGVGTENNDPVHRAPNRSLNKIDREPDINALLLGLLAGSSRFAGSNPAIPDARAALAGTRSG